MFIGISLALSSVRRFISPYIKSGLKLYYRFLNRDDNPITHASAGSTSFDGVDDYVSIADADNLSFGDGLTDTPFSISGWINMDDATNFHFIWKGVYNSSQEWRMWSNASDHLKMQIFDESVSSCYIGRRYNTAITGYEGEWIHVCGIYDGSGVSSGVSLYINGIRVDDTNDDNAEGSYVAMENLGDNIYLGRRDQGGGSYQYSGGSIANVGIWSRALSASEVQGIMYKKYADLGSVDKASLVSWYGLDATSLGSELITGDNSTFTSGLGDWTTSNNWNTQTNTDGKMVLLSNASNQRCLLTMSLVEGRRYEFTYDASSMSGTITINSWVSGAYYVLGTLSEGTANTLTFERPSGAGAHFYIRGTSSGAGVTLDNLFMREVQIEDSQGDNEGSIYGATTNSTIYGDNAPSKPRILDSANPKQAVQLAEGSTSFDGSDYVDLGTPMSYTNHTVAGWVKVTDNTGSKIIFDARDSGSDGIFIYADPTEKIIYKLNSSLMTSTNTYVGEWIHVSATYDGTTQKLYINGNLDQSTTTSQAISTTTNAIIGARSFTSQTQFFKGLMANVSIHSSALTQSQIQELMFTEKYAGLSADLKTNLVSWYDMGETSLGSELVTNGDFATGDFTDWDSSGNGWSVSGGVATFAYTDEGNSKLIQDIGLADNKTYKLKFDYTRTSGSFTVRVYDGGYVTLGTYSSASDSVELDFLNTGNDGRIILTAVSTTFAGTIDNISVTEIQIEDLEGSNDGSVSGTTTTTGYTSSPHGVVDPINYGTLKSGTALSFDGTNDEITLSSLVNIGGTSPHTVFCWINTTNTSTTGGNPPYNFIAGDSSASVVEHIGVDNTKFFVAMYGSSWATYNSTLSVADGNWHLVAMTWDGSDILKMYIDGALDSTHTAVSIHNNGLRVDMIGNRGSSQWFNGKISSVKIFNSALTLSEIQEMYLNPEQILPTGVSSSNLKLHLPMNEGSGEYVYDGSGNQNHGTIYGGGADDSDGNNDEWVKAETDIAQVGLVRQNKPCVIVNDNIDLGSAGNSALSFANPNWSISCWLYQAGEIDGSTNYPFATNETYQSVGALFRIAGADLKPYMRTNQASASTSLTGTSALTPDAWNHVIFTYNGTTGTWYLNGSANGSGSITAPVVSTNQFVIGKSGSQYYDGIVNEFAIWDEALTATEVTALYNSGTPLDATTDSGNYASSIGLQGYWRNDGDTTWEDRTPLGAYGSEQVTNGTFDGDSDSGWTSNAGTTITVTGDQMVITSATDVYGTVFFPISLTEGKTYQFSYDIVSATNHILHRVGTTATNTEAVNADILSNPAGVSAGDTVTQVFTATSTQASNSYLSIGARHDILMVTIDNVSLKRYRGGNDGTVSGSPDSIVLTEGITSGRDSQGFYLTNTDENVLTLNGAEVVNVDNILTQIATDTSGSIEAWVKPQDGQPSSRNIFFGVGDTNADENFFLAVDTNGTFRSHMRDGGATKFDFATDSAVWANGESTWKHLVIVHNATAPTLYVNGLLVDSTFTASSDKTVWLSDLSGIDNVRIGCRNYNSGGDGSGAGTFFSGSIDDVRIYSDALSATEVLKNYNAGLSKHRN